MPNEIERKFLLASDAWLGKEVTHLPRYYNVRLVRHPYSQWSDEERNP